jgi:hypothetical protein
MAAQCCSQAAAAATRQCTSTLSGPPTSWLVRGPVLKAPARPAAAAVATISLLTSERQRRSHSHRSTQTHSRNPPASALRPLVMNAAMLPQSDPHATSCMPQTPPRSALPTPAAWSLFWFTLARLPQPRAPGLLLAGWPPQHPGRSRAAYQPGLHLVLHLRHHPLHQRLLVRLLLVPDVRGWH